MRRANATDVRPGRVRSSAGRPVARANRVANAIEAGTVWINDYGTLPASIPFGGYKHSGLGRENGASSVDHYTQIKTIYTSLEPVERYM